MVAYWKLTFLKFACTPPEAMAVESGATIKLAGNVFSVGVSTSYAIKAAGLPAICLSRAPSTRKGRSSPGDAGESGSATDNGDLVRNHWLIVCCESERTS